MRIAIVCGGGMSSSILARNMEKQVKEKHLEDKVEFIFIPFGELKKRQDEADIALLCPHLHYRVKPIANEFHIPVSIIPPTLYGLMPALDYIDDAEDLLEIWNQTHQNMTHFPDEPEPLSVKRTVSHRRSMRGENFLKK